MRVLKILVGLQAILLFFAIRENLLLNEYIKESADAISYSTRKIENQANEIKSLNGRLRYCQTNFDKYQTIVNTIRQCDGS